MYKRQAYVELLETAYSVQMKACARWLADQVKTPSKAQFKRLVRERIGDWTEAFQAGPT